MNLQYEQWLYVYYIAAALAIVMLIATVVLFFALKIPAVIGDLSGATARKAIENIRNQNENSGDKEHHPSEVNKARGKLTDKISPSGNLIHRHSDKLGVGMKTEKISTQRLSDDMNETTVLYSAGNETTVLSDMGGGETTVLSNMDVGETTLLNETTMYGETGKLVENVVMPSEQVAMSSNIFEIEYEITFIHSQEIIV